MERLSLELISHIASFLEREQEQSDLPRGVRKKLTSKLPPFATISRDWQYSVERRTFHALRVHSTDVANFQAMCIGHRRSTLALLTYDVVLPTYDDTVCTHRELDKENRTNDEAFTQAIERLFGVLKSWESVKQPSNGLSLSIGRVYSPTDRKHRREKKKISGSIVTCIRPFIFCTRTNYHPYVMSHACK